MISVGIIVFDHVAMLDIEVTYRVFAMASSLDDSKRFTCCMVSETMRPIFTQCGIKILPDCVLPPSPDFDVLIIPGGDVSKIMERRVLMEWVAYQHAEAEVVATLNDGHSLLMRALESSGNAQNQGKLPSGRRKHMLSATGQSQGVEMCLQIVSHFENQMLACQVAEQISYPDCRYVIKGINQHPHSCVLPSA